ncbi:MAG: 4Fe-4S dicluster domain-containing protein [Treponema sp.]|nr:4Fe-4S dicluster domain-containing protein [Treponema sp.]
MNNLAPIFTKLTECQDCYKCIRQCPVKAIRVENGHAAILSQKCILCGNCVINCPASAKHVRDDLGKAKQLLTLKGKVIASVAPSFSAEFSDFTSEQFIAALKKIGFWGVSETALGADLVSAELAKYLSEKTSSENQKLFLSSACPAVVEYIKHYKKELSPYITDLASPLLAHVRYLKKLYGEDIGVVFIGPCIAKKRESDVWHSIDTVLTFSDLRRWFKSEGIRSDALNISDDTKFIPQASAKGSLYPVDGGMIAATKKYDKLSDIRAMSISGIYQIQEALDNLNPEELKTPLFMELLSCPGGCVNGPGTHSEESSAMKRVRVLDYAESSRDKISQDEIDNSPDLTGTLPVEDENQTVHTEEEIRGALRSVGKFTPVDELNCSSCGYDSCRHFATAMLDNRAEKTMCVSYMRKLAQKKANSLIKSIPSGVVIANKNLEIVECNLNFAKMMGSEATELYEAKPGLEGASLDKIANFYRFFTDVLEINGPDVIEREVRCGRKIFHVSVFAIEKESIAGGVIEDITAPQVQKHRIVSQARKVIDKNLSVVQKIAYLLGENAAETESILNSIIQSFSEDEDDED